jgi:hypothetical protein
MEENRPEIFIPKDESAKRRTSTDQGTNAGCLILLVLLGIAIYWGYRGLDSIGWLSHRESTFITARGDWLVGEAKDCWSAPLTVEGASVEHQEQGYALSAVNCDDGPQHEMKVTFYGRKVQGLYKVVRWRCEKEQTSFLNANLFTCYETGGDSAWASPHPSDGQSQASPAAFDWNKDFVPADCTAQQKSRWDKSEKERIDRLDPATVQADPKKQPELWWQQFPEICNQKAYAERFPLKAP